MKRFVVLGFLLMLLRGSVYGQTYTLNSSLNGQTITTCSGAFYDSGGPNGDYGSSQDYHVTFVSANPGLCIQVTFTLFDLESATWDYLIIYDGNSTADHQLGKFGGSNSPGTITSSSGALTFVFHSDGSVQYSGWAATISCADCAVAPPAGCNPQSTASGSPCSQQTGANPFCTDENPYGVTYPSGTGSNSASAFLGQSDISCLSTTPRPAWYYMQISAPGNLLIHIQQTSTTGGGLDVDFACWGPFEATSQDDFVDNLCCGVYTLNDISHGSHRPTNGNHTNDMGGYPDGNVVDCSYSAQSTEWCFIPNAQPGQWYLLLITNYNGGAGTITFSPVAGSSNATTNCSLLAPISYNEPLCAGDTMVLTCENPQTGATYHWSGPGGWTATTTVPSVSIPNVTIANTGVYHLQLTGPNITADPSQIEVTVNALPTVSVTANHDTICSGTSVTLTANGAGTAAANYHWTPGNASGRTRTLSPTTTVAAGTVSNTYTVTGTLNGCSSTASYTIVVNPNPTVTITTNPSNSTVCLGDTAVLYASGGEDYEWRQGNGTTAISTADSLVVAPQANTTYRVIATNTWGCTNSATKSVTVRPLPEFSISGADYACVGDSVQLSVLPNNSSFSYSWNTGESVRVIWVLPTENADYEATVTNNYGCTSTAAKHVDLISPDTTRYAAEICWNSLYQDTNFNIVDILEPGEYTYARTYSNVVSCDSVVILQLTVLPKPYVTEYDTACGSYQWRGHAYTQSGVYLDSLTDVNGCLQVDTLHLTINQAVSVEEYLTICDSELPYSYRDTVFGLGTPHLSTSILYRITPEGCDSIINLHLTINYPSPASMTAQSCDAYFWNGTTYTATGVYTFTHPDANGCTQVDTLHLTITPPVHLAETSTACESYEWHGNSYSQSGIYLYSQVDDNGCTQVDTLHLTITPPMHRAETSTACESYEWHGNSYSQSGIYLYSQVDDNGCTQVDTLHLTVYNAVPNVERVIVCEPYTWHGSTHSVTGTHLYDYIDQHGCPCVDTLYLTVTSEPELVLNAIINATCNQDNGEIKINASGGTLPYSYVYLPDSVEASFEELSAGFYHLLMIDSIGCTADAEFSIENIIHQVQLVSVTDAHCGRADGAVEIAASGGFGQFNYQWPSPIVSNTNYADLVPAGSYNVTVSDSNGCSLNLFVRVNDIPGLDACFNFSTANEQHVTFINCTSPNVVSWSWSLGDGQSSTEWQPTHNYSGPGEYPVVLTVVDDNQCVDSLSLMYIIREVPTFYLPSAFIPESDIAENRVFKPMGNSISEENYEMLLFDRWGQLIFVSHSIGIGWDGRINGKYAPQGTYAYQIKYQDLEGLPYSVHGSVLLLRK